MGCTGSKQGCLGENRPKELGKCAAVSADVRWSWLRARTLFTFFELRLLLKLYQGAISGSDEDGSSSLNNPRKQQEMLPRTARPSHDDSSELDITTGPAPSFTTRVTRTPSLSSLLSRASAEAVGPMSKEQFLEACAADETFGLSEVVGSFGSRLFDVLDDNSDGKLSFEAFALGMSKLLKGPENEKLKLMFAAYDLSSVQPSEERSTGNTSGGSWGGGGSVKPKLKRPTRRSKYVTVEDITTVLTKASQDAYPTLFRFTMGDRYVFSDKGSARGAGGSNTGYTHEVDVDDRQQRAAAEGSYGKGCKNEESKSKDSDDRAGGAGERPGDTERRSRQLDEALLDLARRNAANYAERAVSEFGHAQDGALTQKEFEKWASTGPVLRCRMNEFSLDVNVVPFQGVRLT